MPSTRRYQFDPGRYAIIRVEDPQTVADLRADAVAFYKPVNSQEMFAVERIALCQLTLLRIAHIEAGYHTTSLETSMQAPGVPYILRQPEITDKVEIAAGQNRAYWLSSGYRKVVTREPDAFAFLMRYQAQAERLYRRAVEEFERLRKYRTADDVPMVDVEPVIVPERLEIIRRNQPPEPEPDIPDAPVPPPEPAPATPPEPDAAPPPPPATEPTRIDAVRESRNASPPKPGRRRPG